MRRMLKPNLSRRVTGARLCTLLLVPGAAATVQGCTDLSEVPTSAITPENFYRNEGEVLAGVASVYASLRAMMWSWYNISQISTDENVVPTRGGDWFDNGRWIEMHRQTWTANSPMGLDDVTGMFNDLFAGVSRANTVLGALDDVNVPNKTVVAAEVRALRAWYYFALQDMFGGVPIVTTTEVKPRAANKRAEVAKFVEDELVAARAVLPDSRPTGEYGRMTKGAVDAILAGLYLNNEVFTATVTTAGLQRGPARWQDAVTAADRVINSGKYTLEPNWRNNFTPTNRNSKENVFVARHVAQDGLGLTISMRYTHYNSMANGGWNGFATIAEIYNAFDATDDRRTVFLVGPQVDLNTGAPIKDRAGNPLVFTLDIRDITQATEAEGARIAKFRPDPAKVGNGESGNDYPYYRLSEMYLIKAEALNELGQTAQAIAAANLVRARVSQPALSASLTQAAARTAIRRERLLELVGEAKRRQDLIRWGEYTSRTWLFKGSTEPYRVLLPIPQAQIEINPLLKQNPGY
ncbi:MAG: RagB/SusD family nutrient uptake outer membrane protein [Gemmatimonadaceae bacterium]